MLRLRSIFQHLHHQPIARMSTIHNTNQACCSIPPVQSDYTPKGTIKSYGGFDRVYITGPEASDNAIVSIYDIFGYFPQTQQGADIIASTLNTTVYMPDFFHPDGAFDIGKFPPKSDQDKADLQAFFGGTASPPANLKKLTAFGETLKTNGAKSIGVYGMCWGGKVAVLSGGEGTPFSAISILHPAMLSVDDASKLTVPLAMYISKDEPVQEYEKILDVLSKKPFASQCESKNYLNMFHGWAAARGDLKNEENLKEFKDVYSRLVHFFKNTLV